ncbi:hypothetical protein [Catenulispora rubra]|uniref:hypothetical protein n=1 Tax=Catenulispora rubra TaxID=280293 RepID=UPI00189234CF|nr:hypothetical protein [Catenulispora rubra]
MEPEPEGAGERRLTAEEYDAVRTAVAAVAGRWAGGQECTLNNLLGRWRGVAADFEDIEGYSWCGPELSNDVWCRTALAKVWPLLPARVRQLRQPELDELDGRFRAATVPWPGHETEIQWWTWRVPRILAAERDERYDRGWLMSSGMMPFPKPDSVDVVPWT